MAEHALPRTFEFIRDATGTLLQRDLSALTREELQELLDLIARHPDTEPLTRVLIVNSSRELRALH